MSSGSPITMTAEKAIAILQSPNKIDLVTDDDGNWTGESINKAHIVSTQEDFDRLQSEGEMARIEGRQIQPSNPIRIKKYGDKYVSTPGVLPS